MAISTAGVELSDMLLVSGAVGILGGMQLARHRGIRVIAHGRPDDRSMPSTVADGVITTQDDLTHAVRELAPPTTPWNRAARGDASCSRSAIDRRPSGSPR